ncbi:hypothetical protein JDV02_007268 [Purpureocillium takamizusanense]|uniref:Sialidase domain-containing protein n=1 Tax=Purpureocillium takamizusanense TaxID=2060973 RepID=A0A9Q8QK76_9HYPO|nr:uncharacterized protein JDV02_007268 [Purpureocillium takamizusanense]UNI21263.1 hypothetical protein JDV02_007268 [Purpureocillium takamizusanense]
MGRPHCPSKRPGGLELSRGSETYERETNERTTGSPPPTTMTSLSLFVRLFAFMALLASACHGASIHTNKLLRGRAPTAAAAAAAPQTVDRSDGASYMRTTQYRSEDDIVGVYESIEGDDLVLRVAASDDAGVSWYPMGFVLSVKNSEYSIGNPHILALEDGRLLCAHRNHRWDPNIKDRFATFGIGIHQSWDGGKSWQELSRPDDRIRTGVDGIWEPFLRISPTSDKLQVFWSNEMTTWDQDIVYQESDNYGETWSAPVTVAGADRTARDGMPSVVNVESQAFTVFESGTGPLFVVDIVSSNDDNMKGWGDRHRIYTPKGDNLQAGAPWVINVGGILVVSFMTNEDTRDLPNVDGGELKIVWSTDRGVTWSSPITVGQRGSHWPGMMALNDTDFLVTWSQDGSGMLSQKFRFGY